MHLVTICVPVYNVEKYIKRCAKSLFEQTYNNIEFIFVDDCSQDKSIDELLILMEKFPKRYDSVKIIKHPQNRGLSAARNTAVENSTGDYIIHVDSDDWLENNTVEKCVESIISSKADIVYFDIVAHWKKCDEILSIPQDIEKSELLKQMLSLKIRHCLCGGCYKRSLYFDYGIKAMEGVDMAEDLQVSPLLLYYAESVYSITAPFYHYDRTTDNSYTSSFSEEKADQNWISINKIVDFFEDNAPDYIPYIEVYKLKICFQGMRNCCIVGGHSAYLKEVIFTRLKQVDKKYWKEIPFLNRLVFYLKNEFLIKIYVTIAVSMHRFIKMLSKQHSA